MRIKAVINFSIYFIIILFLPYLIRGSSKFFMLYNYHLFIISTSIFLLVLYLTVYYKKIYNDILKFLSMWKFYLKKIINSYGLLFGLSFILYLLYYEFGIKNLSSNQLITNNFIKKDFIKSIFLLLIYGPIVEELVFRLSLRKLIKRKTLYICISSILFGFIHIYFGRDYIYVFPYVLMGVVLSYIYIKTENIIVPILTHLLQNIVSIILMIFIIY